LVDSEAVRYGGNLQIFVNGQWRYVKSNEWSVNEASVACRQMGFKSYNTVHDDSFHVSSLKISQSRPLCNFACDGTERRLLECISSGLCNGNETYIGIVCSRSNATISPKGTKKPQYKINLVLPLSIVCALLGITCMIGIFFAIAIIIYKLLLKRRMQFSGNASEPGSSDQIPDGTRAHYVNITEGLQNIDGDNWEMFQSDFRLQREIGAGSFATVYKGLLSLTATSSMIEKYKNEMTSKGESIYTVAVKVMKGIL
jgi:hypothetical protein